MHSGWPDFLLIKKFGKNTSVMAIEVKRGEEEPRDNQWDVLCALADSGLPVRIEWDDGVKIDFKNLSSRNIREFDGLGVS